MKREWEMLGPRFPRLPVRDEDASLRGWRPRADSACAGLPGTGRAAGPGVGGGVAVVSVVGGD